MRKRIIVTALAIALLLCTTTHATALSDTAIPAIQALLDEACSKSGAPGVSASILHKGEVIYVSSGYADKAQALPAGKDTQYELASVSKAFTGVGILLLEEQGLLDMTDPVQAYLPWLTFTHAGRPVDMGDLTLNHFLHHTSGLTNGKHFSFIPEGDTADMLFRTVELLSGAELAFEPGAQNSYGTVNYDVLGLVMEAVTGQSYEDFMQQQVLQPLGLYNTHLYQSDAQATGQLAQGYRTSFMVTTPYDAPVYRGNKPAGYILSSAADMARWMGIHLGLVPDIPQELKSAIEKSHQADTTVPAVGGMYYAGGWEISEDQSIIAHTGGNSNFSTAVTLFPDEQTAICLLSNGANTNVALAGSIKAILDGDTEQGYQLGATQIFDIVATALTVTGILLAAVFVLLGLRRRKTGEKQPLAKKTVIGTGLCLILAVAMGLLCLVFPVLFGHGWATLLVWQSYSLLTAPIALALLFGSAAWFVYSGRYCPGRR